MKTKRGQGSAVCCPNLQGAFSVDLFKALGDTNRLSILWRLSSCESMTVGEIASCCPRHLSVISRHLSILKRAGVVATERKGKEIYYRLQAKEVAENLRRLAKLLEGA